VRRAASRVRSPSRGRRCPQPMCREQLGVRKCRDRPEPWESPCSHDRRAEAAAPCHFPVVNGERRRIAGIEQCLHRAPYSASIGQMKDADAPRAAARPVRCGRSPPPAPPPVLAPYIDKLQPPKGKTIVIGAGKASAAMGAGPSRIAGIIRSKGLVVTRLRLRRRLQAHRDRRGGPSRARREGPRRRQPDTRQGEGPHRRRPRALP